MSSYIGRHAELYDLFYAKKPYSAEAGFVHSCIQKFGEGGSTRMLELACGTGNHALEFEKLGYRVTATDYSPDMLEQAKKKGKEVASQVEFLVQDMRSLTLPDRSFDVVVCLFDSLGYVATNEAMSNVLRGVQRCLRPGGLFIFEFWHAAALIKGYDPLRIRRWILPDREVLRISETDLDVSLQLASVTYSIYEMKKDGTYSHLKETQTNRYFLIQEMANFLTETGFIPSSWNAGFAPVEQIDQSTWHVVAVARTSIH